VNDHPDLYFGDLVQWTCNIYKFLGDDPNGGGVDIACWEYTGTYDGVTGDGSLNVLAPYSIDTSQMHSGDDIQVYGTVGSPFQGTNAYGGTITDPQVDAKSITDLGHDPNA
jgi:hypothetical protein